MDDNSFMREKASEADALAQRSRDPVWEPVDESNAIVQRLFVLAAERVGSISALGQQLGLSHSELRPYLTGEALPSKEVFLRTVGLVIDDLHVVKSGFSEEAWRSLSLLTR